ncbi:hypothetical protein ADUPG1_003307, partial [Aduncisulcus paluster]
CCGYAHFAIAHLENGYYKEGQSDVFGDKQPEFDLTSNCDYFAEFAAYFVEQIVDESYRTEIAAKSFAHDQTHDQYRNEYGQPCGMDFIEYTLGKELFQGKQGVDRQKAFNCSGLGHGNV